MYMHRDNLNCSNVARIVLVVLLDVAPKIFSSTITLDISIRFRFLLT